MARDIGTVRDALQTRLATLDNAIAFDVATGSEDTRLVNGVVMQVFPTPPDGASHWPTQKRGDGAIRYTFTVYLWVGLSRGLAVAQDILDGYVSPRGTHDNSVQQVLEVAGDNASDSLDTLSDWVRVESFGDYRYGLLNREGKPNALVASMRVQVAMTEE